MNSWNSIGVDITDIEKKTNEELVNIKNTLNEVEKKITETKENLVNYSNKVTEELNKKIEDLKNNKKDFNEYFYNKMKDNLKLECSKEDYLKDNCIYKLIYCNNCIFEIKVNNLFKKENIFDLEFIIQKKDELFKINEFKAKLSDILESIFSVENDFLEIFELVEKDKTVEDKFKNFIFIKLEDKSKDILYLDIFKKKWYKYYDNKLDFYNKTYKCIKLISSNPCEFNFLTIEEDEKTKEKKIIGANLDSRYTDIKKISAYSFLIDKKTGKNKLNNYFDRYNSLNKPNIINIITK